MDDEQYHQRLAHNLAAWQREGLVTEHQARAILEREGIVLLFAANSDATPSWFRVSTVFTGMAFDAGRAVS